MRATLLRTVPFFFLLAALVGCDAVNDPESAGADAAETGEAAAIAQPSGEDLRVPGRYIVVLAEEPVAEARATAAADLAALQAEVTARGASVRHVYEHALTGFSAAMSADEAAALAKDPRVLYVEQDQWAYASGTGNQGGATWGIDRIDQRSGNDTAYNWRASGEGVTAYVVDTGMRISHGEFGGRASYGYDFVDNDPIADDCNGHGTHVAGTIGGATWGVAKDVALVAVRVLDCRGSGATSGVIAGVDWVTANAARPAVANMSLGGSASAAMDAAVQASIASGVQYSLAAGNGFLGLFPQNACGTSPARVPEAITVSATNSSDARASWANYGDCVDFFAPGIGITSAWYDSDSGTNTISGTSMAAPHVAGVAAMYLEVRPNASPQQVRDVLFAFTTKNVVQNPRSVNAHLLYNGGSPSNLRGEDTLAW